MIIHNTKLITWGSDPQLLSDHAILIRSGKIEAIGKSSELKKKHPNEDHLDAGGQYLMPGNICAHTHFYGAFARGLSIPGEAPADFPKILEKLWWPLDKALDEDTVRFSAQLHLIDAIRNGTTSLIDHHASPNFIDGSLDLIAESVFQSGLRAVLCYEVSDRDGQEKSKSAISENLRFIQSAKNSNQYAGRVAATFGLHASLTLSDKSLEACREANPADLGFHIHVAEHEVDQQDSLAKSDTRVVHRLEKFGILGPRTIAAHAVHVDEKEIEILAESSTWISHQARSNMNNGVGVADVEALLVAKINLCLGNDGFTQDMWTEWKTVYLLHKMWHRDPRKMNGMDVINMAVNNNASLINSFFPEAKIGEISKGANADLILIDYHPFTPMNTGNIPWHILFGFQEKMITMTMVDGNILMQDGKILTMDEEKIAADALQAAPDLWKRYESFVPN